MGSKVDMKIFKGLALVSVGYSEVDTPDSDGCELLDATCNHEGFQIVFNMTCRNQDYRGVSVAELYANGWTQNTTEMTFGGDNPVEGHPECQFEEDPSDSSLWNMRFNFRQCGTDHLDSTSTNLIYKNTIQSQEYYNDIIMGSRVRFQVTCSADRVAEITRETGDVSGDTNHEADDQEDRPTNWVDEILTMQFYTDNSYANVMDSDANVVPFGDTVYAEIVADDAAEAVFTRVTDCWATADSDLNSEPRFDLLTDNCSVQDWVSLTPANNGADATTRFNFRSFRFPAQNTFHLHCRVYLCHADQTDCIQTCDRRKRRSSDESDPDIQDNGIPRPEIMSAEIIVPMGDIIANG